MLRQIAKEKAREKLDDRLGRPARDSGSPHVQRNNTPATDPEFDQQAEEAIPVSP